MPSELLQDEETKAQRHRRLHKLFIQLRDLIEERKSENLKKLDDLIDRYQLNSSERTIMTNTFCLMLQAELDKWQGRHRLAEIIFKIAKDLETDNLENQISKDYYQLPLLKVSNAGEIFNAPKTTSKEKSLRSFQSCIISNVYRTIYK